MMEKVGNLVATHSLFVILLLITVGISLANMLSTVRVKPRNPPDWEKVAADLSEQQKQRMWDQVMHDDNMFNDRLNFLLVFESVLLGVGIGAITSHSPAAGSALEGFAVFGLLVTLLWSYIQARHKRGLDALKNRTRAVFPEYTLGAIVRGRPPFSSTWLLTYPLPWLVAAVWLGLLFLLGG
jgi:hypothetical protein